MADNPSAAQQQFSGTMPVAERQRFDTGALEAWLRERVEGFSGPITVDQFKGGQSTPTFMLSTPGRRYVMRSKEIARDEPHRNRVTGGIFRISSMKDMFARLMIRNKKELVDEQGRCWRRGPEKIYRRQNIREVNHVTNLGLGLGLPTCH